MAVAPPDQQQRRTALLAEALRQPLTEGQLTDEEVDRQLRKTAKILNYILGNSFDYKRKPQSIGERIVNGFLNVPLFHPLRVITTLIQLGHEPVPPRKRYNLILLQQLWYYPGVIGYGRSIVRDRGWRGLYRGAIPGIIEGVITDVVSDHLYPSILSLVNRLPLQEVETADNDTPDNVENVSTTRATIVRAIKGFLVLSVSKCTTEVISRPFKVISLRAIAQHVGQETLYSSFRQSVRQIYAEEGLVGFYRGLAPALLEHVLSSLLFEVIIVTLEEIVKYIPSTFLKLGLVLVKVPMAAYFARSYTYPFRLVSTVMAVNGTGLAVAVPTYTDWKDCWNRLSATGSLYRGSAILFPRLVQNYHK